MMLPFLTISPRIKANETSLTASTNPVLLLLTLGLYQRKVTIDRQTRAVTIQIRTAWFHQRANIIDFKQISAVTYGYEEESFSPSVAHDTIDRFIVGLRPIRGAEIPLFWFTGDGNFTNNGPLPDWWYWDDILFDVTGTQEKESRVFAQLVSKLLNVTIQPSTLTAN